MLPDASEFVTSPSYLSFAFRDAGLDTANITIKCRLGRRPWEMIFGTSSWSQHGLES